VVALEQISYLGLVLHESSAAPSGARALEVLVQAAFGAGVRSFAPEGAFDRWITRARVAAEQSGAVAAPTEDAVVAALRTLAEGKHSFAEMRETSIVDVMRASLGHEAAMRIDRLAPERVVLRSGRNAEVHYEAGKPAWIASYLQDFFGTLTTPKI